MNAKRDRRWLRFSLRSMLVVITVAAIGMASFGPRWKAARDQRLAVDEWLAAGGGVGYDYQVAGLKEPAAPAWLRRVCGEDVFRRATNAAILSHRLRVTDLSPLARFPYLTSLYIQAADIDDQAWSQLEKLTRLKSLTIESPSLSNDDVSHLARLPHLEQLRLVGDVSDAALPQLASLPNLRKLECEGNSRVGSALRGRTRCEFELVPLAECAAFFQVVHEVPLRVDTADAIVGKKARDVAISANLSNVRLAEALTKLLEPHGLGWVSEPAGLLITTREKADQSRQGLRALQAARPDLEIVVDW